MRRDPIALLEHYGRVADNAVPPISLDEIEARHSRAPQTGPRRIRPLVAAAAAAAISLLLIGGVALWLRPGSDEAPVVTEPGQTSTTVTVPDSTTVPQAPGTTGASPPPTMAPEPPDVPGPLASGNVLVSAVATEGDTGHSPLVTLRADGSPVVTFLDRTAGVIGLVTCADAECVAPPAITTVELDPDIEEVSGPTGLAISADGLPMVFHDGLLSRCVTPDCEAMETFAVPLPTGSDPGQSTMVLGAGGLPVVASFGSGDGLTVTVCSDGSCASATSAVVDPAPRWGNHENLAMAIASDGSPVLAYATYIEESGGNALRLARCADPGCAGNVTVVDLATGLDRDSASVSLVILPDGRPHVVWVPFPPEGEFRIGSHPEVFTCSDPACSTTTRSVLDASGRGVDHAVAGDGTTTIAASGTAALEIVTCRDPACSQSPDVTRLTSYGPVAEVALVLGPGGTPVMAFAANTDLRLAVCTETPCDAGSNTVGQAAGWSETVIATDAALVGANPGLLLDGDGLPVVLHSVAGERDPLGARLIRCRDAACTEWDEQLVSAEGGSHGPLALGPDGLPVLAFHDWERLSVAVCDDPLCTSLSATILAEAWWFDPLGLVVAGDGSPIVTWFDGDDYYHDVIRCAGRSCDDVATATLSSLIDGDGYRWWPNSVDVVMTPDGAPVALIAQGDGAVMAVACTDPACGDSVATKIGDGVLDWVTSAAIVGADGMPIVAYYADATLQVARCETADCTSFSVSTIAETANAEFIAEVGPSVALGPDGNPVVAYWAPGRIIHLAWCQDPACSTAVDYTFGPANTFALAVDGDGYPIIVHHRDDDLVAVVCTDPSCAAP